MPSFRPARHYARIAAIALLTCAAPHPLKAQPARDTLRIAVLAPHGLATLDPHLATAHHDRMLDSWIYGALVRFKPGSINPTSIEPDLAERWTTSPDGRIWTFFLRPGVTFHHGFGPVTAADVVFSLQKAADPKTSAYASDFAPIQSVEALDPATIRITLKHPIPSLLGLVSNYAGGFILSQKAFAQAATHPNPDPASTAIGFGPFMIANQVPGQSMQLDANDAYFRGPPKLRHIAYTFVAALSTSDLAFNAGELDIIEGQQDQAWITRTSQTPNTAVDVIGPAEISWLHLNITQKPLDDPRIRRAIALAINRPELVAWRGPSLARAAQSVIPQGYLGFAPTPDLPATNIAEARTLLAQAGYPNGITIKTIHTSNPVMLNAIQVVQAQLRRANITLEIQVVDHLAYNQLIRKDASPVVHYAAARFPIADTMLTQFFHSQSTVGTPTAVTNFSHCQAADTDLDTARTDPDPEHQLTLWANAQHKIIATTCAIPLLETLQVWARRTTFHYGFPLQAAMSTGPLITETAHFTPTPHPPQP